MKISRTCSACPATFLCPVIVTRKDGSCRNFHDAMEKKFTVRAKRPVQQAKHKIIPKCHSCRGFIYDGCTWKILKCNQYRPV
jgi:hypothetical protein